MRRHDTTQPATVVRRHTSPSSAREETMTRRGETDTAVDTAIDTAVVTAVDTAVGTRKRSKKSIESNVSTLRSRFYHTAILAIEKHAGG